MSESEFSPKVVRRNQILLGIGLMTIGLLLAYFWVESDSKTEEAPPPPPVKTVNIQAPGALVDDKDAWRGQADKELRDMTKRMDDRFAEMERRMPKATQPPPDDPGTLTKIPDDLRKVDTREPALADVDAYNAAETRRRADLEKQNGKRGALPPPPPPSKSRTATPVAPPPGRPGDDIGTVVDAAPAPAVETPRKIRAETIKDVPATAATAGKSDGAPPTTSAGARQHVGNYLPIGFMEVSVLMGIDAPTGGQAQSNPLPVFLHVTNNAVLANRFRYPVKDCLITGFGTGDLSSERVLVRTDTLSCNLQDGTVIEVPLKGHVAGEDGKYGFRGRLVEKTGQALANAARIGIASGIGQFFQQSATTQSVSPLGAINSVQPEKALQSGMGAGFSNALTRLSQYYIQVAEKIFPVLEVDAGRVGEVAVAKGVVMPVIGAQDGETGAYPALEQRNKRMNRYDDL